MTAILEKIKDKAWTDEEFMALGDYGAIALTIYFLKAISITVSLEF
jgi:hypothetical protein